MKTILNISIITAILIFVNIQVYSQNVAISDDANYSAENSAVLDIKSTTKGLLIPRVQINNLNEASPVTSPVKGLLVFSSEGNVTDGFYFWDGTSWKQIASNDNAGISNSSQVHFEMYENSVSSNTTIDLTNKNVYYGWKNAIKGLGTGDTYISYSDNATADRLVAKEDGIGAYRVSVSVSFGAASNTQITGVVYKNGVAQSNLTFTSNINNTNDIIPANISGTINLTTNDYLDLRFTSDKNSNVLKIYTVNFYITRVGQ